MAKKTQAKNRVDGYRFTCICKNMKDNYSKNFITKEEALEYTDNLNQKELDNIEWYGVYEIDVLADRLRTVKSVRLIPHDDTIKVIKEVKHKK